MFAELVELGKRIRTDHDALKAEKCCWDIVIDEDGNFIPPLIQCDREVVSEFLPSKKGKARLILDKAEETLKIGDDKSKHEYFRNKLSLYSDIPELFPVFKFYEDIDGKGVSAAREAYLQLSKKEQKGNLTFMLNHERIIETPALRMAIIDRYEQEQRKLADKNVCVCSVCGKSSYPILKDPHGSVKMPKGQTAGSALVSYNTSAFESYNLTRNENSAICTNCARNYVEALKYLTSNGHLIADNRGEEHFKYTNRQKISDDTIAVFWTKHPNEDIDPFDDMTQPTEERVRRLLSSVVSGDVNRGNVDVENFFYCCTLSSAAARIAVRDWVGMSIQQYKENISKWFKDVAIIDIDGNKYYPKLPVLIDNCIRSKSKPTQSDYKAKARIGSIMWHAALTGSSIPLYVLASVVNQILYQDIYKDKAALIRLIINRQNNTNYMKDKLDLENNSKAYLCGRLFALICKLQFIAQGEVNSSIKDRFFASASSNPAMVMGLLLTKYAPIYSKKAKGAYNKQITEIASQIGSFPKQFSTIERGEFALGYYFQYATKQNDNINN